MLARSYPKTGCGGKKKVNQCQNLPPSPSHSAPETPQSCWRNVGMEARPDTKGQVGGCWASTWWVTGRIFLRAVAFWGWT
ncbi:hypothetical protein I7I50_06236 [Histoplasma capsulatum G186AR]|uniref:Uncharacterized protein n=1 Tax=Ajellomyces capsulatus TaxID=5037 RepID=A0A8H7Z2X6_AJECA|nr:hypothetical protein I7I52_10691 [Histoplasma capsulatum]QSS67223.1 hypothetical protein I7I50_06236 [Histoplasma capsulatum G186AR]